MHTRDDYSSCASVEACGRRVDFHRHGAGPSCPEGVVRPTRAAVDGVLGGRNGRAHLQRGPGEEAPQVTIRPTSCAGCVLETNNPSSRQLGGICSKGRWMVQDVRSGHLALSLEPLLDFISGP